MGFALHEMYEVSGLMIGDAPYEEYVLSIEELHLLKKSNPLVYETYWKVLFYFHIRRQVTRWRSGGIKQLSWTNYLFPGVNKVTTMSRLAPVLMRKFLKELVPPSVPMPPSPMKARSNQT